MALRFTRIDFTVYAPNYEPGKVGDSDAGAPCSKKTGCRSLAATQCEPYGQESDRGQLAGPAHLDMERERLCRCHQEAARGRTGQVPTCARIKSIVQ